MGRPIGGPIGGPLIMPALPKSLSHGHKCISADGHHMYLPTGVRITLFCALRYLRHVSATLARLLVFLQMPNICWLL